jgi:hypothetical protein
MPKKISQLTALAGSLANTDLLEIAEDAGAGNYDSRKITVAQLKGAIVSNPRTIDLVTGTNVTGTTALTSSASILIPANTITVASVLEIQSRAIRVSGTASTIAFSIYINTANNLTGATLLGSFISLTASNFFSQGLRSLFINPSTNQLTVINNGATVADDYVNTGANTVLTYDETTAYYIHFVLQLSNSGDTGLIQFGKATLYE